MTEAVQRLAQWLRDAHAMEEQAETLLNSQINRLEHYPALKARLDAHLGETRQQAKRLADCLGRMEEGTSTIKDAAGRMTAFGQGVSGLFVGDEVVKGVLASYTFEHMEIASYRILVAAAEEAGDVATMEACKENLREEEAMAAWLEDNLPDTTRTFLRRETAGATAKH